MERSVLLMMLIKEILQDKGFTLTEILVALAILAIIISSFTTLLTGSVAGIFNAGRKSEALFKAQEAIENRIAGVEYVNSNITVSQIEGINSQSIVFKKEGFTNVSIETNGKTYEVKYDDGSCLVILKSFVPN